MSVIDDLWGGLQSAWDSLNSAVQSAQDAIKGTIEDKLNWIISTLSGIVSAIQSGFNAVQNTLKSIYNTIVNLPNTIINTFIDVGRNFSVSIINFIHGGWDWLYNLAIAAAGGNYSAIILFTVVASVLFYTFISLTLKIYDKIPFVG